MQSDARSPFLTYYRVDEGTRIELSARTFANWVDKTVNLMASMDCEDASRIAVPLLLDSPGHWVGLVWAMAVWQAGATLLVAPRVHVDAADLAVVGPADPHPIPGVETVACSLHPLGLPFAEPTAGVTDYAEVLNQPDVHWSAPAGDADPAFTSYPLLLPRTARQVDELPPRPGRLLVRPDADPWELLARALVGPLLGGGSVVVVAGAADPAEVARIAASEQAVPSP